MCHETYNRIRSVSDRLCDEYGLSVLENTREQKLIKWEDKDGVTRYYEPTDRKNELLRKREAGDTIFFDWDGDGHTDHIGLVIGRDSEYVYTVEGNSGDAVKCKQYRIGSSVIYGFGLMNY